MTVQQFNSLVHTIKNQMLREYISECYTVAHHNVAQCNEAISTHEAISMFIFGLLEYIKFDHEEKDQDWDYLLSQAYDWATNHMDGNDIDLHKHSHIFLEQIEQEYAELGTNLTKLFADHTSFLSYVQQRAYENFAQIFLDLLQEELAKQ